jgi:hypothetical protein
MDTPAALFHREGSNREIIVIAERPYKPQIDRKQIASTVVARVWSIDLGCFSKDLVQILRPYESTSQPEGQGRHQS